MSAHSHSRFPSRVTSPPSVDLGPNGDEVLRVYYAFVVLGGQIGLPILLATFFFGRGLKQRCSGLISVLVSFFLFATSALLLFYSGQISSAHSDPNFTLCLIQASLIYGCIVLVASSIASLMIKIWIEIRGGRFRNCSRTVVLSLLCVPWALFLIVQIGTIILGTASPSNVSIQRVFFCDMKSRKLSHSVAGITIICVAVILYFGVAIARVLWNSSRQVMATNRASLHLAIRVIILTVYAFITFVMAWAVTLSPKTIFPYIFFSTLPLAAFLVFGMQMEVLFLWWSIIKSPLQTCKLARRQVETEYESPVSSTTTLEKPLPPLPPNGDAASQV